MGADEQWLMNAREYIQWLRGRVSKEQAFLERLVAQLENTIVGLERGDSEETSNGDS